MQTVPFFKESEKRAVKLVYYPLTDMEKEKQTNARKPWLVFWSHDWGNQTLETEIKPSLSYKDEYK